jgi:3-oxoacyl-ACP reductase-like protein
VGEKRGAYRVVVRKPEGKGPFGETRHRWEDNIKLDLQEGGCRDMDWIDLAQDRDRHL